MSAEIGGYQTDFDDDREPAGPAVPRTEAPRRRTTSARSALKPPRAHPRPRFGGGRRFPAVELWLRQLRRGALRRRRRARAAAHPGVGRGQRRRRVLVPAQRSPEIRAQIESFAGLWPRAPRHSPIAGIVLTNGDLDHCLGLLSLRESHPLVVYATDAVRARLHRGQRALPHAAALSRAGDLAAAALGRAAASRAAESTRRRAAGDRDRRARASCRSTWRRRATPSPEDNIGLLIRDPRTGGRLAYFSGVAGPSAEHRARAVDGAGARLLRRHVLVQRRADRRRPRHARAEDMAHWPVGGPDGSLALPGARAAPSGASSSTSTTPTRSCARTAPSGARSRRPASRSPTTAWS